MKDFKAITRYKNNHSFLLKFIESKYKHYLFKVGTSNYPLLDRVGFQHGFKENMKSIPTSQSSNIKEKKQWWVHKLNAWEDY
jgi:hypothetical protein